MVRGMIAIAVVFGNVFEATLKRQTTYGRRHLPQKHQVKGEGEVSRDAEVTHFQKRRKGSTETRVSLRKLGNLMVNLGSSSF